MKGLDFFKAEIKYYASIDNCNQSLLNRKLAALNDLIDSFNNFQKRIEELEMQLEELNFKNDKIKNSYEGKIFKLEAALLLMGLNPKEFSNIMKYSEQFFATNIDNLHKIGGFGKLKMQDYSFSFYFKNVFPKQQELLQELIDTCRKITPEEFDFLCINERVFQKNELINYKKKVLYPTKK